MAFDARSRRSAFFATVFSTVSLLTTVIVLPLFYTHMLKASSLMLNEVDHCRVSVLPNTPFRINTGILPSHFPQGRLSKLPKCMLLYNRKIAGNSCGHIADRYHIGPVIRRSWVRAPMCAPYFPCYSCPLSVYKLIFFGTVQKLRNQIEMSTQIA